jgi:hypothetical protein
MLEALNLGERPGCNHPQRPCVADVCFLICFFSVVDVAWLQYPAHTWRSAGFGACQSWDLVLAILEMMQQVGSKRPFGQTNPKHMRHEQV